MSFSENAISALQQRDHEKFKKILKDNKIDENKENVIEVQKIMSFLKTLENTTNLSKFISLLEDYISFYYDKKSSEIFYECWDKTYIFYYYFESDDISIYLSNKGVHLLKDEVWKLLSVDEIKDISVHKGKLRIINKKDVTYFLTPEYHTDIPKLVKYCKSIKSSLN